MFTGLIEETGLVKSIRPKGEGSLLEVAARVVLEDTRIGDSISINGACQTVTAVTGKSFTVFVSRITSSVSTLGTFAPGLRVNLERAMTPNSRFGGHIVQGHVDGAGIISSLSKDQEGLEAGIEVSPSIMRYITAKGSAAVDGISLTVVSVSDNGFTLYLIPETLNKTTISDWKKGSRVNIEVDILAKYVEKMLNTGAGKTGDDELKKALAENGFL
ncbi:MAG: riboflavin synthase [Spirochaetia bacterium]|jgi:riboflavin synthase|nr:riboflavin synthase [Spirochaetia bacterium]